jgi:hypothetical protein
MHAPDKLRDMQVFPRKLLLWRRLLRPNMGLGREKFPYRKEEGQDKKLECRGSHGPGTVTSTGAPSL